MTHLDGNALAGLFADTLGIELTAAIGRCGSCHRISELARAQCLLTQAPSPVDEKQLRELHIRLRNLDAAKPV